MRARQGGGRNIRDSWRTPVTRAVAATVEMLEQRVMLSFTIAFTPSPQHITEGDSIQLGAITATAPNDGGTLDSNFTVETRPDDTVQQGCTIMSVKVDEAQSTANVSGQASIQQGSTYSLGTDFEDPGGDAATNWTIDWGDGQQESDAPAPSYTHVYNSGGDRTITATATSEDGKFSTTQAVSVIGPAPSAPGNLTAVTSGSQINLNWAAATGTVTGYNIQRSNDGTQFSDIAKNVQGTSFSDTSGTLGDTYWYRVYACNGNTYSGYSNVPDQVMLPPPMPTNIMVTGQTPLTALLGWTASNGAVVYIVLRKGPNDGLFNQVGNTRTPGFLDQGLTPQTVYQYEITASNYGGSLGPSNPITVTTPAPPSAPTNLTDTVSRGPVVTLNWTASTGNVTAYHVERSTNGGSFTDIDGTVQGTGYVDSTVLPNTSYVYRVRAEWSGAFSDYNSNPVTVPLPGPVPPTDFTASGLSDTSIQLAWTAPSDPSVISYDVYRGSQRIATGISDTSFTDTGLSPNTSYSYTVVSRDSVGETSAATSPQTATTYQLSSPSNVLATAVSISEIDLSWANTAANLTGVAVWRSTDGQNFSLIASLPPDSTTYSDLGLSEATGYFYGIQEISAAGTSGMSLADTITFPAAPTALAVIATATDTKLSWTDNSQNEDGFEIFRSTDGSTFTQIDDVTPNTTSYEDVNAPYGKTDYYYVKAVTAGGESAASNTASVQLIGAIQAVDLPAALSIAHGKPLSFNASTLLATDTDPNGLAPSIANFTQPQHGSLTQSGGSFTYTPANSFFGTDTFTYTATDSLGASSNSATVSIQVFDGAPRASSQMIPVVQTGNDYAGPASGTLSATDPEGDTLTFSASVVWGPGTFSLNSQTGAFTYTPDQNNAGPALIRFTATDGTLTSNTASLLFPGYTAQDPGGDPPDNNGDESLTPLTPPQASNGDFSVLENGALSAGTGGLLVTAADMDTAPDPDSVSVNTALIDQPQHGTLISIGADGSLIYQPNTGFVGEDYFTWQVLDGSKAGEYATAFINVQPLNVSLSIDNLTSADPTAMLYPGTQTPIDPAHPDATLHLNLPSLPDGSTVTLSVDDSSAVDVWQGSLGGTGLIGRDPGTSSYTWTVTGGASAPASLLVQGLTGTDYGQVVFHLNVTPGPTLFDGGNTSPVPKGQAVTAAQAATVPGKGGYLVAFDGTWDYDTNPDRTTAIVDFEKNYTGTKVDYHKGVGNEIDHPVKPNPLTWPNTLVHLWSGAFGGFEANAQVGDAINKLTKFYSDPKNRGVPLDLVGYSRGAFEAVKLENLVFSNGLQVPTGKPGQTMKFVPWTRFIGIVSAVNQMGPLAGNWPTSIPSAVGYGFQALDNEPNSFLYPQTTITFPQSPNFQTNPPYPEWHGDLGVDPRVVVDLETAAQKDGVPVTPTVPVK